MAAQGHRSYVFVSPHLDSLLPPRKAIAIVGLGRGQGPEFTAIQWARTSNSSTVQRLGLCTHTGAVGRVVSRFCACPKGGTSVFMKV